jgi:hypothetical protein
MVVLWVKFGIGNPAFPAFLVTLAIEKRRPDIIVVRHFEM